MSNEKRLIDANALEQIFLDESRRLRKQIINDEVGNEEATHIRSFMPTIEWARKTVHGCATVEAKPVVHAKWVKKIESKLDTYTGEYWEEEYFSCPICGKDSDAEHNFCPNCGAKMDGGNEDG